MGKYGFSVWMGGLPERVRSRDIDDFFKGYGRIVDISIKTKYAFVEFEDERDAADAVKDLDDQKLNGSRVRLEVSKGCKDKYRDFQRTGRVRYRSYSKSVSPGRRRHRSRSPVGRGRSRSRSPARGSDKRETFYSKPAYKKYGAPEKTRWTVEVDNLSSRCSWQDLKDFMRKAGEVTYGDAHGDIGRNRGVVCYEREDDAKRAIDELDGREFNGRDVKLTYKVREEWGSESSGSKSRGRSRSRSPRRSRSRSRSPRRRSRSRSRSGRRERGGSRDRSRDRSRSRDNKSRERSKDRKDSRSRSRSKSAKRDSRSRSR